MNTEATKEMEYIETALKVLEELLPRLTPPERQAYEKAIRDGYLEHDGDPSVSLDRAHNAWCHLHHRAQVVLLRFWDATSDLIISLTKSVNRHTPDATEEAIEKLDPLFATYGGPECYIDFDHGIIVATLPTDRAVAATRATLDALLALFPSPLEN